MPFSSLIRHLMRSPLTQDLIAKLQDRQNLQLTGIPRLPKGVVASTLARSLGRNLLVVCASLEEAGRWTAQMEMMGWDTVDFYPTSEASPYDPFDPESEMIWGQMQVLSHLTGESRQNLAIITTERALQPHLPPPEVYRDYGLTLQVGNVFGGKLLDRQLAKLGYERVGLVETEGQWSRRGDLVDIFPVSAELPVRLEWLGDEIETLREFDPATQRSLDALPELVLTPTSFSGAIAQSLSYPEELFSDQELEQLRRGNYPEGMRRFLGVAFNHPASLLDYLAPETLIAVDEVELCRLNCDRWVEHAQEQWQLTQEQFPPETATLHHPFAHSLQQIQEKYYSLQLSTLTEDNPQTPFPSINLSSRPLPTSPHQFAKLAEILRGKRDIYSGMNLKEYATWLISAQPSRSVSLLQEHDCPAQFVPNIRDYPAIERLVIQKTAIALKYSGLAELEGFILPTFRVVIVTDREFFGQHTLASPSYIRKRRRAASKKVDPNKLSPGDYVVHKSHGIGKFLKLERLGDRDYLALQYADGILRVPADSFDSLSRFQPAAKTRPDLDKMTGKVWQKNKAKIRKLVKKLAVDLLALYAKRSKQTGFAYPPDTPWQQELEDSFPYQATPDQLKAVQDVKQDLEQDRPMDRLVCGDVGFGKTEVAVRAIFKVVTTAHKQVAFLAPTTILTQQHYHTLKERFAPYPINVGLLNRFRTASERREILKRLETGELDIVVGTHQLLSKSVKFKDLGLLVIDEEQRFGVNQKEKIKALKTQVDVLTLSATPIPRTLYMAMSGIREMSLITTPPPSRRPIKTHLSPYNPEVIRTAIRNELDRGGQVFYVVPRVEGIEGVAAQLQEMLPGIRIAIAHGQCSEAELESTMLTFSNGEADLLVCTTIIESGLDIPRVNTIIVEDSQRFGLSQLYQLRGRVGRAGIQAHAWLLYPQQGGLSEAALERLRALQEFTQLGSGYQLASRDMEIRGVGNILGAEQSGQMTTIGFDLYMEMLQEAIREIQGQAIPTVEETSVDLKLTAFIPNDYIPDLEQKMAAYRAVATAHSKRELDLLAEDWRDRYGEIPSPALQLIKIVHLKQLAKSLGFSRIKPDGNQHIVLETPMEEPAWRLLQENLPQHLRSRFVFSPKKVTVRGLGTLKPQKQLENLIEWLEKMQGALPDSLPQ
ncbi:transcription-repair coupling factor [Spirulina subsalsa]|uniref:transcription-repair coupling factor n=1 Tax=Spirulina subsalsa TaxID=54311 RepID=UPI0003180C64|nr:transcription-repair coupling factor [Spirulina subsalsa]